MPNPPPSRERSYDRSDRNDSRRNREDNHVFNRGHFHLNNPDREHSYGSHSSQAYSDRGDNSNNLHRYDRNFRGRDSRRDFRQDSHLQGRPRQFHRDFSTQNRDRFSQNDNAREGGDFVHKNSPIPESTLAPTTALTSETGNSGRPIDVVTNNYLITTTNNIIWQFNVDLDLYRHKNHGDELKGQEKKPITENDSEKNERYEAFLKKHSSQILNKFLNLKLGDLPFAYDGSKTLFFQKDIERQIIEDIVEICSNGRNLKFSVKIQLVTHFSLEQVSNYYNGKEETIPECLKQLFDIIFRDVAGDHYKLFNGSNFDVATSQAKHGIEDVEFVSGFKRCVRQTLCGYVLNVHMKTACILSSRYTTLEALYSRKLRNTDDLIQINHIIKHLDVYCTHGKYRIYKIDKIIAVKPGDIFLDSDKNVSMIEYYKEKYNTDINPRYPVLKVQARKDTFLPLELCSLQTQQFLRHNKLSPNIQREILTRSTNPPNVYFNKVQGFVKKISQSEKLESFGLRLNPKPLSLKARVLPSPRNTGSGRNDPFVKPTKIQKYSIFCFDDTDTRSLSNFCHDFENIAKKFGLRLSISTQKVVHLQRIQDVHSLCKNISERLSGQIILMVIPKNISFISSGQLYNIIKYLTEREFNLITQCLRSDVVRNLPRGYFENFLLKVNGKYDGLNQELEYKSFEGFGFDPSKTMIIGYDVNHPGLSEISCESIVAISASQDSLFSKFTSRMYKHSKVRIELIPDLEAYIEDLFLSYKRRNGFFPRTLIVFRDGISSGQFETCRQVEIRSIEGAILKLGIKVKIVFLVVQKKHGVRFSLIKPDSGRSLNYNVPSGTVVDSAIVSTTFPNFFLTSHYSPLGTARNVHYYVLQNDQQMSLDQLENFVYRTCFNSIRSRQVSFIPLVLRYVDLLAYRGKIYSEANQILKNRTDCHGISKEICDNLFYC